MKSEAHPNGFVIKVLHTFFNGARLRLHRWLPDRDEHNNDPHDHRTWFISIPLWGLFTEHRFKEVDGDSPIYRCRDDVAKERLEIYQDGQSNLELISSKTRIPFVPYFCSQKEIHTVQPKNKGFAASLVLFGPPQKYSPKVWIKKITSQKVLL